MVINIIQLSVYGTSVHAISCFMEHLKEISTEAIGRDRYSFLSVP